MLQRRISFRPHNNRLQQRLLAGRIHQSEFGVEVVEAQAMYDNREMTVLAWSGKNEKLGASIADVITRRMMCRLAANITWFPRLRTAQPFLGILANFV